MSFFGGPNFTKLAKQGNSEKLFDICTTSKNIDHRKKAVDALASMSQAGMSGLVASLVMPNQEDIIRQKIRPFLKAESDMALAELLRVLGGNRHETGLEAVAELGILGNDGAKEQLLQFLANLLQSYGTSPEQISQNEPESVTLELAEFFTRACTSLHQLEDNAGVMTLIRLLGIHADHMVFARAMESQLSELTGQDFGGTGKVKPWIDWYEATYGSPPEPTVTERTFSETIHEILEKAGLNSNIVDDNYLECRFDREGSEVLVISISLAGDLSGFPLVCISMPIREAPYPLRDLKPDMLLQINAKRMVGKFQIRRVANTAMVELTHKMLYDGFSSEDFLAAFGTIVQGGSEYLQ